MALESHRDSILGIQYLRGIAALMVVFHHARLYFENAADWTSIGAAGVDIFFVISGFIMAYTTRNEVAHGRGALRGAAAFLLKRAIRVVPLYWLALLWESKARFLSLSVDANIWKDFFFIPHYYSGDSGPIWPALMPGWTVNLEMLFYLIFAIAILFGRAKILIASLVLMALVSTRAVIDADSAALKFYSAGVVLEFVMGMAVYLIYMRTRALALPPPMLVGLLLAAALALALDSTLPRFIADGVPAMLIVYASIRLLADSALGGLRILGDASYSIYLFHLAAFVGARWLITAMGIDANTVPGVVLIVAVHLLWAVGIGVLIYYTLERPLLRHLRGLLAQPRSPQQSGQHAKLSAA